MTRGAKARIEFKPGVPRSHVEGIAGLLDKIPGVTAIVKRKCDGCGVTAPDAQLPEGWIHLKDGRDYCASCALDMPDRL